MRRGRTRVTSNGAGKKSSLLKDAWAHTKTLRDLLASEKKTVQLHLSALGQVGGMQSVARTDNYGL